MNINVSMFDDDDHRVDVLKTEDGRQWIRMAFGRDCAIFLPGYGVPCGTYARSLAVALIAAADKMDVTPAVDPVDEPTLSAPLGTASATHA